jgi:hypothetical protein
MGPDIGETPFVRLQKHRYAWGLNIIVLTQIQPP